MGIAIKEVVANRTFSMQGKSYKPGDYVNVSGLPEAKVGQLLNQRWLRPATAEDDKVENEDPVIQ